MVRISVIAAFGAAIFLSGCGAADEAVSKNPDALGGIVEDRVIGPATQEDVEALARLEAWANVPAALGGKISDGRLDFSVRGQVRGLWKQPSDVPGLNPLRLAFKIGGEKFTIYKRAPLEAAGVTRYRAMFVTGEIHGEVIGYVSRLQIDLSRLPAAFYSDLWPSDTRETPALGSFMRDREKVIYGIYPDTRGRDCLAFNQTSMRLALTGTLCMPPAFKLGKARAEAIIRGIGLDPYIVIEPVPDLLTLSEE